MSTHLYEVLERLIAFDTVSTHSDVPAMEYLASELDGAGFKTALHHLDISGVAQANLVAWAGPPRPDGLIISGHLDTVPVEGQPGWAARSVPGRNRRRSHLRARHLRYEGFPRAMRRGRAHHRSRAPDAAARFRLHGGRGSRHARGFERHAALQDLLGDVPRPNLAWIGEPTSLAVFHAHKCVTAFEIARARTRRP